MAATVLANYEVEMAPYPITAVRLSSLVSDQLESVVPAGALVATGIARVPYALELVIEVPPTSRVAVNVSLESKSTTTGAVGFRVYGGDLTDMVVTLLFKYRAAKAGGLAGT